MKTVLFALALALALPIGAQEPMTYARLCGATEGMGDNNDFCTLWAQNNWQGMRNALSISIRTARAEENRNRFYFDHKRGAERGAFIQLKRPWMGDDWQVRQDGDRLWTRHGQGHAHMDSVVILNRDRNVLIDAYWIQKDTYWPDGAESWRDDIGYRRVRVDKLKEGELVNLLLIDNRGEDYAFSSDFVRRIVECVLDDYGWSIGEVEDRPDCEGREREELDGDRPAAHRSSVAR